MRREALLGTLEQMPCGLEQEHDVVALVGAARVRLLDDLAEAGRRRVAVSAAAQPVRQRILQAVAERHRLQAS